MNKIKLEVEKKVKKFLLTYKRWKIMKILVVL